MDQISIPSLIFVSFPEEIIIALLGILAIGKFSVLKSKLFYLQVVVFSLIFIIISYFVRRVTSNFVEVAIITLILLFALYLTVFRFNFYESIIAAFLGFSIFTVTQILCITIVLPLTGLSLQYTYSNDLARFLVTVPERVIQIILIALSIKFEIKIIDLESTNFKKREYILSLVVYIISICTLIFSAIIITAMLFLSDHSTPLSANSVLIRIYIYITLFITIILTFVIRSINDHYKKKSALSNAELLQTLNYLSNTIDNNNYVEARTIIENLKNILYK